MNRVLFDKSELESDATVRLTNERHVHIRKVLRACEGDTLQAGVIGGDCCCSVIREISKEETVIECTDWSSPAAPQAIDVVLAVPRPIMLNRLWSLLSSMGVRRIDLVIAGHTDPAYVRSHVLEPEVVRRQMLDGLQQAANLTALPDWSLSTSLATYLAESEARNRNHSRILLEKGEIDNRIPSGLTSAVLAIGPERGWQQREVQTFLSAGFTPASLGHEIYRTEVACLAAVAVTKDRIQDPS